MNYAQFRRTAVLAMPLFWATLAFTFYMAVKPVTGGQSLFPWDKAEHFTAFYVLTGIGAAAFSRRPLWLVGALLSAFGALIEIVQATPLVHRDCDFWDWVADTLGVLAVIAPTLLPAWRAWRVSPSVAASKAATGG